MMLSRTMTFGKTSIRKASVREYQQCLAELYYSKRLVLGNINDAIKL